MAKNIQLAFKSGYFWLPAGFFPSRKRFFGLGKTHANTGKMANREYHKGRCCWNRKLFKTKIERLSNTRQQLYVYQQIYL